MGRLLAAASARSSLANPGKWMVDWLSGGIDTPAGVRVDEDTALHYGPFFAGVRLISEDAGSLPFPVYRRLDPRGKERVRDHRLHAVLNDAPNPMMSAQVFREVLTGHAITWGVGAAEIVRDGQGEVEALWPLRPDRLTVKLVGQKRRSLAYKYEDHNAGIVTTFLPGEILAVHGFGWDGVRGYSAVEMARRSIGLGIVAEIFGSKFFGGDGRPSGVLTHPGVVSETAKENMRKSWAATHKGPDNAQRIAILEEGVTWQALGIPPGDAQFLETRRFEVVDMARWLRIQPHKLGELDRATWNNIESEQISYVSETLRIWLTRWESAAKLRLFTSFEREQGLFAEHVIEGLLRGDMKTRFEGYKAGREIGVYNADDIAEMENRNPLPDGRGQVYMVPLNWVPAPTPEADEPLRAVARRGRSVESRRRIARSFRPLLADADERMAKMERTEVTKLVRLHYGERRRGSLPAFTADVDDLYETQILDKTVERWTPALVALAAEIGAEAAVEVGVDDPVELGAWVAAYVAVHSAYRIGSSKRQIIALATEHADDTDALIEAVRFFLDSEVEVRPDQAARWESTQLANGAARETFMSAGVTRLVWVAVGDSCPYCKRLDGKVVGVEQPFVSAGDILDGDDGATLPVEHNTFSPPVHPGCVPGRSPVSATGVKAVTRRWYSGELVVLRTAAGDELTVTANHPVLTQQGWLPAGLVGEGDDVFRYRGGHRMIDRSPHEEKRPTLIEDVWRAACVAGRLVSVPLAAEDLHGDGVDGEIDIVYPDGDLPAVGDVMFGQPSREPAFVSGHGGGLLLDSGGPLGSFFPGGLATGGGSVGGGSLRLAFFGRHAAGSEQSGVAPVPRFDAPAEQFSFESGPVYARRGIDLIGRLAGQIEPDRVVEAGRVGWSHWVYNLHTDDGWYSSNSHIVSNCDCSITPG